MFLRPFLSIRFLLDFSANFRYVLPSGSNGRTYRKLAVGLLLTECSAGNNIKKDFKSTSTDTNTVKRYKYKNNGQRDANQ